MISHTITTNDADQRIDRFLRKLYPGLSMGDIFSGLRKGRIKLNSKKAKHATHILVGDVVTLYFDPNDLRDAQKQQTTIYRVAKKLEKHRIIHEDEHIIAYDKPAGLVVHPTDHKTDEVSLIEQVHEYLSHGEKNISLTFSPALAHRIDRETSGIILIAKTKHALEYLTKQFRNRTVQKEYLALVHGHPKKDEGDIVAPLHRSDENKKDKAKVIVNTKLGLTAQTGYEVQVRFSEGDSVFSLVACRPKTGRMHQIRVHMSHIGHPIIGDRRYRTDEIEGRVDRELLRKIHDTQTPPLGHLLHAYQITFDHPNGERMTLKSPWKLVDESLS